MRAMQWITVATFTLLLCGCPPTTDPDEDMGQPGKDMGDVDMNTPEEDMRTPPDEGMTGEPDMGGEPDMKGGEDMTRPFVLDCGEAVSKDATIRREAVETSFAVLLSCKNDPGELERRLVKGNPIFQGTSTINTNPIAAITPGEDGGSIVSFEVPLSADLATLPVIPLDAIEFEVEGVEEPVVVPAHGPVTHLSLEEVARVHRKRSSSLAPGRSSAIFPTSWSVILERPSQPPSLLTLDYVSGQKSLVSSDFGGGSTTLEMEPSEPFDATSWVRSSRGDEGTGFYAASICRAGVSGACGKPLTFTRVHTNKLGELVLFGGTGDVDTLATLPFEPSVGVFETDVVSGPLEDELRVFYSARDENKGTFVWVTADAFSPKDDLGALTTERLALVDVIAGVTPKMVAEKSANIGLLRSPKAPADPEQPAADDQVLAWTARPGKEGGTTFARAAIRGGEVGIGFQERTILEIEPGSASMQYIDWGKGGRAVLYSGADATGIVRAWVVALDDNTLTETGPLYSLDFGHTYLMQAEDELTVTVSSKAGDDTTHALFAVVIGINNTKKDPEVPLEALLMSTDTNNLPANSTTIHPFASAPLTIEDQGMPTKSLVALSGGIATLDAIDTQKCKAGGCPTTRAVSPKGYRIQCSYDRGVQAVADGQLEGALGCEVVPPGENAQALTLFEPSPGYSFLISRRTYAFETIGDGGVPSHTVMFPIRRSGGLNGLLAGGELGLLAVDVLEGVAQPPREITITQDGNPLDLADVEFVNYDTLGKRGVIKRTVKGDADTKIELLAVAADDNGGLVIEAIIDVVYDNAGQQKPATQCSGRATCALTGRFSPANDVTSFLIRNSALGVDVAPDGDISEVDDFALLWIAEDEDLKEGDDGFVCGSTPHFKPVAGGDEPPIRLATSNDKLCLDLPKPAAVGSFLGGGGEQLLLTRHEPDGRTSFHLLVPARRKDGSLTFRLMSHGQSSTRIDILPDGRVFYMDVNEDGILDVAFEREEGGLGFLINNGVDGFFNEEAVSIPGLSESEGGGWEPFPGGPSPATSSFGKGTKESTTQASAKPELL